MKNLVILTGAGISAESGIATFRDAGGLWEGHDVMDVASIEGWEKNPALVLDFYNIRRQQLKTVKPNAAHLILKELEEFYNVNIITQNVDDLHERAGSQNILHLHGQLNKVRSIDNPNHLIHCEKDIFLGDFDENQSQLRPHIVWFGEDVPAMYEAVKIVENADIFVVIGTSLQVYPAASLLDYVPYNTKIYYIDPNPNAKENGINNIVKIKENAVNGTKKLYKFLVG